VLFYYCALQAIKYRVYSIENIKYFSLKHPQFPAQGVVCRGCGGGKQTLGWPSEG
jgi:hypothetical protein